MILFFFIRQLHFSWWVGVFLPPHTDTHTPTPIGTLVGVGRLGYDVAISEDNFQQYARSWADREMKVYSTHTHRIDDPIVLFY